MITYIMAFIFYTLAMVGILLVGFIVYKKTFAIKTDNKSSMRILESLQIAPKKQLLIVQIKNEKFLIASGVEHTTFLAKLQDNTKFNKRALKEILRQSEDQSGYNDEIESLFDDEQQETDYKPSGYDSYNEMYEQQSPRRYSDFQQARLDKIQKQFNELYELDEKPNAKKIQKLFAKKDMVKKLIKDLNETTSAKVGNGFNG